MKNTWRADPLIWGHGPRVLEVFLEPTCPFSVKAFGKLDDLLGQAGEDQITIKQYARQNGIHVSPTFMIDGLVQADMSSGDPVVDWQSAF
jgi:hypothetical protein